MVDDDDDSDYGHSKKKGKKVSQRGRKVEKKEKKSPKPRLKATGTEHVFPCSGGHFCSDLLLLRTVFLSKLKRLSE